MPQKLHFNSRFLSIVLVVPFIFNLSPHVLALTKTTTTNETVSAEVPATISPTDTIPPLPPILISPPNHSYLNNPYLHFIWRQTNDPNSNTLIYTFHLNQESYSNLPSTANLIKTNYHTLAKPNTFNFFFNQPLADGLYTWYVTAADANQNQVNSAIFQFTLDTTPPSLILTTIDQHQNLNLTPSDSPISLKFNPNHTNHHLTVTTEPNTLVTLIIVNLLNSQTQSFSQTCSSSPNPCHLTFNLPLISSSYQLQINAFDQAHNSTNLPTITLTPIIPSTSTTFLPATLAQLQSTRYNLALIIICLLAISIIILIIYKRRRWNLNIVPNLQSLPSTITISHSPPHTSTSKTYKLKPNHRYFIPKLQPKSLLIIQLSNQSQPIHLCLYYSPNNRYHLQLF